MEAVGKEKDELSNLEEPSVGFRIGSPLRLTNYAWKLCTHSRSWSTGEKWSHETGLLTVLTCLLNMQIITG